MSVGSCHICKKETDECFFNNLCDECAILREPYLKKLIQGKKKVVKKNKLDLQKKRGKK